MVHGYASLLWLLFMVIKWLSCAIQRDSTQLNVVLVVANRGG